VLGEQDKVLYFSLALFVLHVIRQLLVLESLIEVVLAKKTFEYIFRAIFYSLVLLLKCASSKLNFPHFVLVHPLVRGIDLAYALNVGISSLELS